MNMFFDTLFNMLHATIQLTERNAIREQAISVSRNV